LLIAAAFSTGQEAFPNHEATWLVSHVLSFWTRPKRKNQRKNRGSLPMGDAVFDAQMTLFLMI
jgi:hypothetical protein